MTNANRYFLRVAVLSFFLAAALLLSPVCSYAEMEPSRFAQWMKAATDACNIVAQSTLPVAAPIADFLVDPFNIVEGIYTDVHYLYPRVNPQTPSMTLESYLQRSSIRVRGDTVTIDGIDYTDIWVTNEAAQAFRTNVLDLQTAFNIVSNSNGKFVSGSGSYGDIPVFDVDGVNRTQNFYSSDQSSFSIYKYSYDYYFPTPGSSAGFYRIFYNGSGDGSISINSSSAPMYSYVEFDGGLSRSVTKNWLSTSWMFTGSWHSDSFVHEPFDFTWVAQDIPAETLDSDDGIHLFVPNNPDQFSDPVVKETINNFNVDLSTNFELDSLIDLGVGNNYSLLDHVLDFAFNLDFEPHFGPSNYYPPSPTPTPTPTEPVPWPTLEPTPTPAPTPSPVPTPEPSVVPTALPTPGPDTPMSDVTWSGFSDWADNLESSFFGAVVDAIGKPFESLWNIIKNATGIWRYVVAWVGNISVPLNWSLTALGSAGSYFLSPFAAIAAAAVVISVYRRIGK